MNKTINRWKYCKCGAFLDNEGDCPDCCMPSKYCICGQTDSKPVKYVLKPRYIKERLCFGDLVPLEVDEIMSYFEPVKPSESETFKDKKSCGCDGLCFCGTTRGAGQPKKHKIEIINKTLADMLPGEGIKKLNEIIEALNSLLED